jgi:outer membrane immunogenic protein
MPWFATFRGRIGITPSPTWLLYVTGGAALAEIDQDFAVGAVPFLWSTKTTKFGWVIGAGAEAAIGGTNWTVKAEYLHMDFGSMGSAMATGTTTTTLSNFPAGGFSTVITTNNLASINTRVTDEVFRVGLNYRFGAVQSAVVTRY